MFKCKLLGEAVLYDAAGPLTGRATQKRCLALLALLAGSSDQGVSRDRAAAYLWPDYEPSQGRRRLSDTLYVLRSELGDEAIASSGGRLLLNADLIATDVAAFEEAIATGDVERAVEVYGGPFLNGVQLDGVAEFMHWVETERERLARTYKQVLRQAAETSAEEGRHRAAVTHWRRLSAHDPYDSQVALGLMRALEAAGNRPLALRHGQKHADILRRDLDAAPDPAVTAFVERLRNVPSASPGYEQRHRPARPLSPPPETDTSIPSHDDPEAEVREASAAGRLTASRTPHRRTYWRIGGAAVLLLLVTVLARFPILERFLLPRTRPHVVVVMPFKNETGRGSLQVLRPMTADWITRGLSRTGLVDVIDARLELGGVDAARSQERGSVRDLARRLGAGTLVWGRYYRERDSLYLQAQIVDVSSGKLLRAGTPIGGPISRPLESVERLRQRVMVSLSALLNPQLTDWAKTSEHLPSYAAYRTFIEGQEAWLSSGPAQAREAFRQAVALDSTFVLARAYLAKATGYAGSWAKADSILGRLTNVRHLLSPLMQAELQRMTAFCHGAPHSVLEATRRMVELAPHSTYAAWSAADAEVMNGHPGRALDALRVLKTEDAVLMSRARYGSLLAYVHHLLGDDRQALQVAGQARQQFPREFQIRVEEIRALAALGRVHAVRRELADAFATPTRSGRKPAPLLLAILAGRELSVHGYTEEAQSIYAQVLRQARASGREFGATTGDSLGERTRAAYGRLLYRAGRKDAARRTFAALASENPDRVEYSGLLGVAATALGDTSAARAMDRHLARLPETYLAGKHLYYRARIAALLGAESEAVALLRQAVRQGLGRGYPYLFTPHNEPDLRSLGQHVPL